MKDLFSYKIHSFSNMYRQLVICFKIVNRKELGGLISEFFLALAGCVF